MLRKNPKVTESGKKQLYKKFKPFLNVATMRTQEKRPKLKIGLTPFDKLLEAVGWCIILVIWIALIISYAKLPEIIPTHNNAHGVIDGYKNKSSI